MSNESLTVEDARQVLGISKQKMATLIKDGTIHTMNNPLDHRSKLITRQEVERLMKEGIAVQQRKVELDITYLHHGALAHVTLSATRPEEQSRNLTERYLVSELYRFSVDNFTSILVTGDNVKRATLFTKEVSAPGVTSGWLVSTDNVDDDLGWPPPNFDPAEDRHTFLVHIEYLPDGNPFRARWATR